MTTLVLLAGVGCGGDAPDPAPTPVETVGAEVELYSPWHEQGSPSPFPSEGQWFFRDRLSQPTSAVSLAVVPADDDALRAQLPELAGRNPVSTETLLTSLEDAAARSPGTLDILLDDPSRDVRFAAARLLYRCMRQAVDARDAEAGDQLASCAARHLRDDADEVSLLMLDTMAMAPVEWPLLRLVKTFGRFDNHPAVVLRSRAAAHLVARGNFGGVPLLLQILKEQTPLQSDTNRSWDPSPRTAWWKEEALVGIERMAGHRFLSSPDATPKQQAEAVRRIETWWHDSKVEQWASSPPLDDPELVRRIRELILAMGTFQLRNVDNAEFVLTHLGPPVAPHLLEALDADSSSTQIRRHVIEILRSLMPLATTDQKTRWVEHLTEAFADADPRIALRALAALAESHLEQVVPMLQTVLQEGDPAKVHVALEGLAHHPSARAQQVLQEYAASLSPDDSLWLAAAAADLAAGRATHLEPFLATLAGDDARLAQRATVFVSWLVDADDFSTATDQVSRAAATERLRSRLEPQLGLR